MNRKEHLEHLIKRNKDRVKDMRLGIYPNETLSSDLRWLAQDLETMELLVKGMR